MNIMEIMARHSEMSQSTKIDLTKLVEAELNNAAAAEEQPEEQPEVQPEVQPEEQPEEQPKEQPKEQSEEQSEAQSEEQSEEQPEVQPEVQPEEKSEEEQAEEDQRMIEATTAEALKELGLASSLGFTQDQADAILASIDSIKEAQVIIGGDVAPAADTDPVLTRRTHTF